MPSEIIFDIPSANLGILFLIFLATTLITRFLALILRMKEQALAFSVSQLAPKFLDFGVGFCRDCFRLAYQYYFAGFYLHRSPSADRCTVDISATPRPASRFPCEMVARAASGRPALRPAAGIRQLGLLGPDFD